MHAFIVAPYEEDTMDNWIKRYCYIVYIIELDQYCVAFVSGFTSFVSRVFGRNPPELKGLALTMEEHEVNDPFRTILEGAIRECQSRGMY